MVPNFRGHSFIFRYCWWFRNPANCTSWGKGSLPQICLQGFSAPSKRSLGRGFMVAINNISNIFYFHPEPWGRFSPILTVAYFSDGLWENPPTIPIGSMYGIYMDPMGYSSSSRLSSVTQKPPLPGSRFVWTQSTSPIPRMTVTWTWKSTCIHRFRSPNDFCFSKYEGNSVYWLIYIYIYVDMFFIYLHTDICMIYFFLSA